MTGEKAKLVARVAAEQFAEKGAALVPLGGVPEGARFKAGPHFRTVDHRGLHKNLKNFMWEHRKEPELEGEFGGIYVARDGPEVFVGLGAFSGQASA